jgi:VanZ family protein
MSDMTDREAEPNAAGSISKPIRLSALTAPVVTWGPITLGAGMIFWFSSQPSLGEPNVLLTALANLFGHTDWFVRHQVSLGMLDALSSWFAHFFEYAFLALAALWAVRRQWPGWGHACLLAFGISALYAVSDEAHQYYVPGRHTDWRDVAMDLLGAATSLAIAWAWLRSRRQGVRTRDDSNAIG